MIKGICIPTQQEHKGTVWPSVFSEVPRINDYVRSSGGECELKVAKIVHSYEYITKKEGWFEHIISLPYRWIYQLPTRPSQIVPFIKIYLDN